MSKNQKLVFAGIILLGTILRCIAIGSRNIQYDDAFSYFLSRVSLSNIIVGTAADTMPPLYYFLLHFWQFISNQIWFLRVLSVLFSMGALVFLFLFLKSAFSSEAALWAAFFAAISPLQIYHAQDIRMYALLAFCGMGYLYFFYLAWRENIRGTRNYWSWVGLIFFGTAAMYTHNLAFFWIISPVFFVLYKRDWKFLGKYLVGLLVIGLLVSPWLLMVPGQVQKIQSAFWTPRPGLVEVFQAILMLTFNLPALSNLTMIIGALAACYILVFMIIGVVKYQEERDCLFLLVMMTCVSPLLLFIVSYLIRPVFVIRGFLPAQLAFLGLAGVVTAATWKKKSGMFLAGLIVLNSLISLPMLYSYAEFPRSPFQAASEVIEASERSGYFIVHDNKLSYFPVAYYFSSPGQVFLKDAPGSANDTFAPASQRAMGIFPVDSIEAAAQNRDRVAFVVFEEAMGEYEAEKLDHPALAWLREHYILTQEKKIGDLAVFFFDKK